MKPILFNTEMVRAILEGRKTVTRRVIKPRNPIIANQEGYKQGYGLWIDPSTDNGDQQGHIKDYSISPLWNTWKWYIKHYAPYQVGDILYVRETWFKKEDQYYYRADFESDYLDPCETLSGGYPASCRYRSCETCTATPRRLMWHPSIHMPKEAARIFLKVTDVRVERLQEITPKEAGNEGVSWETDNSGLFRRWKFHKLWDSTINKKDRDEYGWNANPWVWVIEFERIEKGENND